MQNVVFDILKNANRPIVILPTFHNTRALIDTGAVFPIWCGKEKTLKGYGAEKILDSVPFGGFGGMTTGKLYRLPVFNFGCLIFPNMNIIVHEGFSITSPLILPATIFNNLIFEINNKLHTLKITIPDDESNVRNFIIREENGHLRVFVTSA
ncbi:MAG: hypothetical protein J6I62_07340 [Selenomonadaceae bacterium]|nr:hypothetical protein [Selenomonadaceae bacterium]